MHLLPVYFELLHKFEESDQDRLSFLYLVFSAAAFFSNHLTTLLKSLQVPINVFFRYSLLFGRCGLGVV